MLLIDSTRHVFQFLAANRKYAEIGVYRGEYSRGVKAFSPAFMYLIDPWKIENIKDLLPADHNGNPEADLKSAFSHYYTGGINQALEEAYRNVVREFGTKDNCKIIRENSAKSVYLFDNESLDFVYIDGNHRYDFVLADLERWQGKVSKLGFIAMNDCYVSPIGKLQHLSVLEAVSTFTKLYEWSVVALVNQPFTDILITRTENLQSSIAHMRNILTINNIRFIELPNSLVHAACHKTISVQSEGTNFTIEYLSFDP